MGVRGLTTFINNRAHLYLKDYELHDTAVIIDGNSLASTLYKWHCKSNDCFGGDYDKFAHVIKNFFDLLLECNITPYVIFDGGYEKRKLTTVVSRMKNKILATTSLTALSEGSITVFPLFHREVLVDMVLNLGIKVVRCEYEGDMDIAGIAKTLDCPVISYDSDFYVFGCLYIPFSTVELIARRGKLKGTKNTYNYLPCKIYTIEKFLLAYGGLNRNNLPLLAVLLGNDYVNGKLFAPFFKNLKLQQCSSSQSDQQKRIKSVIVWLQNETIESGIEKVLSRFKTDKRNIILKQIEEAMKGYNEVNDELLHSLEIEPVMQQNHIKVDFSKLNFNTNENDLEINEDMSEPDEEINNSQIDLQLKEQPESDDELQLLEELDKDELQLEEQLNLDEANFEQKLETLPKIFLEKYRACQYPACFMDLVSLRKYYCIPQVEDASLDHSHAVSLDILNIVFNILSKSINVKSKALTLVYRKGTKIQYSCLENNNNNSISVPTLKEIETFNIGTRKQLMLDLLLIDNKFSQLLQSFPDEWHLFLISLKYGTDKSFLDSSIVCSLIICFIILNYVDTKIGYYRATKTFEKKHASSLNTIRFNDAALQPTADNNIDFNDLDYNNCLIFMDKAISYFQMDSKLKTNNRLYDKVLVHSLSQIQSVFLHMKYLNALLNVPYPLLEIHKVFDGTFVYNLTVNLRKRADIVEYLNLFLKECPHVLNSIKYAINVVKEYLVVPNLRQHSVKKHKKKKKKSNIVSTEDVEIVTDDDDNIVLDPNNPYSILASM